MFEAGRPGKKKFVLIMTQRNTLTVHVQERKYKMGNSAVLIMPFYNYSLERGKIRLQVYVH